MEPTSLPGLVLRIDAKVCHVEVAGRRHVLPLAGKLFEQRSLERRPLAVGDLVDVRVGEREGEGAIDAVQPRQSQLTRRSASEGEERAQVLAANLTLVVVVAAVAEPPFQPELVDGILAAAARERIPTAVVLTKVDRDRRGIAAGLAGIYSAIGSRVLCTSTAPGHETPGPLAELAALLHGNRSVLCGLSGVGKSSLLNTVVPGLAQRIGSLNHIRQGRHTTAVTELIPLPGGGHVLDTPGIRNFHLFHTGSQELQFLFPEIAARLPQCGYRNCLHRDEPDCAVRAALTSGAIAATRHASYLGMLATAQQGERMGAPERGASGERRGRRGPRR